MRHSSWELSELVMDETGTMREIAEKLDSSAAHVCVLRRAREDCAQRVIDFWREGELPFELVRQLMYLPRQMQLDYLRFYTKAALGKNKQAKGEARKALLPMLKAARKGVKRSATRAEKS